MQGAQIQPLFDYVLIKPVAAETKTASGIVLAETAKEKPSVGEVMAVGPGSTADDCCGGGCCGDESGASVKKAMVVKKGDKVLYKKWAGNEIKVANEEWLLVEVKDIMAIVK